MTLRFDVIPVHLALEFSTRACVIDAANDGLLQTNVWAGCERSWLVKDAMNPL